jgi:hypothetical protein
MRFLERFFSALYVLRASLGIMLIAVIVLAYADQSRQIFLSLAEAPADNVSQILAAVGGLVWATFICWFVARRRVIARQMSLPLLCKDLTVEAKERAEQREEALRPWFRWVPRINAICIPLATAVGLVFAARGTQDLYDHYMSDIRPAYVALAVKNMLQRGMSANALLYAAALACVLFAAAFLAWTHFRSRSRIGKEPNAWLRNNTILILGYLITPLTIYLLCTQAAISLSTAIGSLGIFLLFIGCFLLITSSLFYIFDIWKIPVFSLLLVWGFFCWGLDLNSSTVEPKPLAGANASGENAGREIVEAGDAFDRWLSTREDRKDFPNEYPVFIVAAAGGGLYAAQYAAIVLARIQDRCPSFAQHVFAYSGVSGGSLGVATFATIANRQASNAPAQSCDHLQGKGPFEKAASRALDRDYFSPLLGSALFPNFFQMFWPHYVESFDRSTIFAATMERYSVGGSGMRSALAEPFLNAWSLPPKVNTTGALLLNTTDVDRGSQVVISPFKTRYLEGLNSQISWFYTALAEFDDAQRVRLRKDIPLSRAIALSAGFPFVFDPGKINAGSRMRLVDGGYTESSGIVTAVEVYRYLKIAEQKKRIRIYFIVIQSAYSIPEYAKPWFNLEFSPIRTLQATRDGRGHLAYNDLLLERVSCVAFGQNPGCTATPPMVFTLNVRDFAIPLAFHLSRSSLNAIAKHAGELNATTKRRCSNLADDKDSKIMSARMDASIESNNCTLARVVEVFQNRGQTTHKIAQWRQR